jgi:hypothetical protein
MKQRYAWLALAIIAINVNWFTKYRFSLLEGLGELVLWNVGLMFLVGVTKLLRKKLVTTKSLIIWIFAPLVLVITLSQIIYSSTTWN